jgi:hypothetical protein
MMWPRTDGIGLEKKPLTTAIGTQKIPKACALPICTFWRWLSGQTSARLDFEQQAWSVSLITKNP